MGAGTRHGGTDLGRRIREHREHARLSQEEVAARAGMAVTYLTYLESDPGASPTPATMARLAAALGTSSRDLAGAGRDLPPGQAAPEPRPVLETVTARECRAYLGSQGIGRFVFVDVRGPVAVPVNYKMLGDDIVFRTHPWTTLAARAAQRRVSLEVDHIDDALAEGWSVLVSGRAHRVTEPAELEQVSALGIRPWAAGERETYIRIVPTAITGRRLRNTGI
jgi:transcriptional regulator with XRE-family HTH domain